MLVSVMALSLILASATETALAGNYRSSAGAYYAALTGLEDVEHVIHRKGAENCGGQVIRIFGDKTATALNPASGEAVTPTAPSGSPGYPDRK